MPGCKEEKSNATPTIRESDRLRHIDGFLVTDGDRCHVTLSTRLTTEQRERGIEDLLNQKSSKSQAGVYLWRHST